MTTMYKVSTTYSTALFQVSVEDLDKSGYENLGNSDNTINKYLDPYTTTYINAQGGNDKIYLWGPGNSVVYGGTGHDSLQGGSGVDKLHGGAGNDNLGGGFGDDQLFGGAGNDWLYGGGGHDQLFGGADNDYLSGGAGSDALYGGAGSDVLYGGAGNDHLSGGEGADTFLFFGEGGVDYISDFKVGEDKIGLYDKNGVALPHWAVGNNVSVQQKEDGQHVYVSFADGTRLDIIVETTDGSLITPWDILA